MKTCANCRSELSRWQLLSPVQCSSCGAFLEIVRRPPGKVELVFMGCLYLVNFIWVFSRSSYPDSDSIFLMVIGLVIILLIIAHYTGIKIFTPREIVTREIPKDHYQSLSISPKKAAGILLGVVCAFIAFYFLVKLGLHYSPIGPKG